MKRPKNKRAETTKKQKWGGVKMSFVFHNCPLLCIESAWYLFCIKWYGMCWLSNGWRMGLFYFFGKTHLGTVLRDSYILCVLLIIINALLMWAPKKITPTVLRPTTWLIIYKTYKSKDSWGSTMDPPIKIWTSRTKCPPLIWDLSNFQFDKRRACHQIDHV